MVVVWMINRAPFLGGATRNNLQVASELSSSIAIPCFLGSRFMKAGRLALDEIGLAKHWVLISKVVEYTGYTDDAIRAKKQRGEWREGVHWRKGPDNRLMFNLVAIQHWMGGCDA